MTVPALDPNRDATYEIALGSTFDENSRNSFHALKYNFKPAAIDYSLPGALTASEDAAGEVSLALPSTTDGDNYVFKGPIQEAKANEFVLVFDIESNTLVLERLSSMTRLSATRSSRTNTLSGSLQNHSVPTERPDISRTRSRSDEDIPTISLDAPDSSNPMEETTISDIDIPSVPVLVTPRLPVVSPPRSRRKQREEPESSDDDSDIDIGISRESKGMKPDRNDDVSDEDLDDLAIALESSLENRPGSSSSDAADSDVPGPSKAKPPDFSNVPRSGGPISMSRFAGGRKREEEESSSDDDDDDD